MQTLILWLVGLMMAMQPAAPVGLELPESPEQRAERYRSIVEDVVLVTYDPDEKPLVGGPRGRLASTLLVLASAYDETRWRPGVESIAGHRDLARHYLLDGGRSYCMMQIHVGGGRTREGWSGRELLEDRTKCVRAGYHVMQRSMGACWSLPKMDRLAAYVSGRCSVGRERSRSRMAMASRWFRRAPVLWDDDLAPDNWEPLAFADGY